MEGYLHMRIAPWLRRLTTRLLALIPAVLVLSFWGEGETTNLIVLSQVILSLQLSFAVIPLIHFTSSRKNMGEFATPKWAQALAWITATIIVGLNGKLVLGTIAGWIESLHDSGARIGTVPAYWPVAIADCTQPAAWSRRSWQRRPRWVTLKPWLYPSRAVDGGIVEGGAGLGRGAQPPADEHDRRRPGAQPGRCRDPQPRPQPGDPDRTRIVLLHVVDTPMSGV